MTFIKPISEQVKGRNHHPGRKMTFLLLIGIFFLSLKLFGQTFEPGTDNIHKVYHQLLQTYVVGKSFDYETISKNQQDLDKLFRYVDKLESFDPKDWEQQKALAYWINLYNAATLELVLQHYPVESIKDIGGFLSSPWDKDVVKVAGQDLTLNEIEHDIIRGQFSDARIHFALNCASIGCPPLLNFTYTGKQLDEQLDYACRNALNDERWVKISDDEIQVTKIFDWYRGDFEKYSGSVREFISQYRSKDAEIIMDENRDLEYMDYNWDLNKVKKEI
ncbi:MAG: DUF547 domain-containing protein [Calditrichae bacterium]|nr:DUF547 domain-containing protein [Calditrichia bacterium]